MDNSADRQLGYLVLICMTALPGDKSQNIVHILIPGVRGLFYLSSSRTTGIFKVHQYCSTAFSQSHVADFCANLNPWGLLDWYYRISASTIMNTLLIHSLIGLMLQQRCCYDELHLKKGR